MAASNPAVIGAVLFRMVFLSAIMASTVQAAGEGNLTRHFHLVSAIRPKHQFPARDNILVGWGGSAAWCP
jgi:hypothetical protein